MGHFLECMPLLDHEFMTSVCCDGDPAAGNCAHLFNPDLHGVPTAVQQANDPIAEAFQLLALAPGLRLCGSACDVQGLAKVFVGRHGLEV